MSKRFGKCSIVTLVALFAGSLVGSSFIDARDRRSIIMWSQVFMALAAAILLVGAVGGRPPLALIYGANALTAFIGAIEHPARSAMTPIRRPSRTTLTTPGIFSAGPASSLTSLAS